MAAGLARLASPLEGVRVLDLTRIVAGPYCTMLLGDLGADVVKVERPGRGDEAREWGPFFGGGESSYFVAVNRNKRSVCVDVKQQRGVQLLRDMALKFDVLVENYLPGKLDRLGLGYGTLSKVAPGLIYCSITGYGPDGPYSRRPGYDVIAAGAGGLLSITGEESGGPVKAGVAVTDMMTGLHAYGSVMAALLSRVRTGLGQKIDCDLLSTQVASLINAGSAYLNSGYVMGRHGTAHASIVPYQAFRVRDGHLIVGAGSDEQFAGLCSILDVGDIARDERFSTNSLRVANRKSLIGILEGIFATKTLDEWLKLLEGAPFPYGPVNTIDKVFDDPHVRHLKLVEEFGHPSAGTVRVVGPPSRFGAGGNRARRRPPLLGEHTDEVLREFLDYGDDQIRSLRRDRVVS